MKELNDIYNKYDLSGDDVEYLNKIIVPIINNPNFKIRMTNTFLHHSDITLGYHILEDSVLTYLLSKEYLAKKHDKNYRIDLAIKISMLHDLYTIPWQNNKDAHVHNFFSKHGFRHPIEAVINATIWYPEIFKDEKESEIIIDGIVHHMFPLPVRTLNKIDKVELKNIDSFNKLPKIYYDILIKSLNRKKLGILSFCRSKYMEGRIMAKADRVISRKQIKNLSSLKALLTGTNKKIKK